MLGSAGMPRTRLARLGNGHGDNQLQIAKHSVALLGQNQNTGAQTRAALVLRDLAAANPGSPVVIVNAGAISPVRTARWSHLKPTVLATRWPRPRLWRTPLILSLALTTPRLAGLLKRCPLRVCVCTHICMCIRICV